MAEALTSLPAWTTTPLEVAMQAGTRAAVVAVAAALLLARRARQAVVALVAGLGAWGLSTVLKEVVGRERPPGSEITSPGFPSTHAAIAAALAVALWLDPSVPRWVAGVGLALAVLTMVARVHVGVHWPLDVVGGGALGAAVAVAVSKAVAWRR